MALVALIVGAVLIAAAIRNTQGVLFSALSEDLPAFMVWAAAIFAVGAIGFIPGLKPVSRGLLALVIVVIIMRNHQAIITGLSQPLGSSSGSGSGASPAAGPDSKALKGGLNTSLPNFAGGLPDLNSLPGLILS